MGNVFFYYTYLQHYNNNKYNAIQIWVMVLWATFEKVTVSPIIVNAIF